MFHIPAHKNLSAPPAQLPIPAEPARPPLSDYEAVGIAEGFVECEDEERYLEAWQYLIDKGLAWRLQGWFGRQAERLINEGLCSL